MGYFLRQFDLFQFDLFVSDSYCALDPKEELISRALLGMSSPTIPEVAI